MEDDEIYVKNKIHSTAIVSPFAIIGKGNVIGPYAVIEDGVGIGDNNIIRAFAYIGGDPEYKNPPVGSSIGKIVIGNNNMISEFVSIQKPILTPFTRIGNNCYIMDKTHVAHDCRLGNDVSIAPLTSLGGYVQIDDYSNLGQGVIIHPRKVVGKGVMIGMNSTVTKDIPDWECWYGSPAKYARPNYKMIDKYKNSSNDDMA